ncbi:hypothetical protein NPIL_365041 [Nephila pilipes]|uniref:Uncharacterized protein n=1 Tax=Nephila pilipes TaxID=299642 RepID=A0A8X6QYX1_NEPPI|nr:hypothetical protein NPIL_365041 [Nephila pilipes]
MTFKKAENDNVNTLEASDLVSYRIVQQDMSNFCENELIRHLKASEDGFTTPPNETIDIAGLSILLVIVRYINGMAAQNDMLICKSLSIKTIA